MSDHLRPLRPLRPLRALSIVSVVAVLAATLVAVVPSAPSQAAPFRLYEGPTFNSATGPDRAKYAINNRIKNAIDHAHPRSAIRIMSWNLMSRAATDHLLRAQRRGVNVRVLMDASNWSNQVPNPQFKRLKQGLAAGNRRKGATGYSAAKVCQGSCRSTSGSAHSKYYMFSQTGASKWVVMEGSANFTLAAATNQWNDLYTWVRPGVYNFTNRIFDEMWRDRAIRGPWRQSSTGEGLLTFSPQYGSSFSGDPVLSSLNRIRCSGARYGNRYHKTIVRYFPDVMRGQRGLGVAKRLKALWNARCDVHVGYTVLSYDAYKVLTSRSGRGPVPLKHMALDQNGNGQFDLYFHLKALTINGYLGRNPAAFRTIQGSANSSGLSTISDENQAIIDSRSRTQRYQEHLDYWFAHAPRPRTSSARVVAARLAFAAPLAVPVIPVVPSLEDDGYVRPGTKVVNPQTGELVDPYANIAED